MGGFNFLGQGVWKSIDSGLTWAQIPETSSTLESFDSRLDLISSLAVSPVNGDLIIGALARIYRYDGANLTIELDQSTGVNSSHLTDVVINNSGQSSFVITKEDLLMFALLINRNCHSSINVLILFS